MGLMLLIVFTSYASLTAVQRQAKLSVLVSTKIQPLVLEMDRDLQEARSLQYDFLLQYPKTGLEKTREKYAKQVIQRLNNVVILTKELINNLSGSEINEALKKTNVNLTFYLSSAQRYEQTFKELVGLVTILAAKNTGLEAKLALHTKQLYEILQDSHDSELLILYLEMQAHEKNFLLKRQRPFMHAALNVNSRLRRAIENSQALTEPNKARAVNHIMGYKANAEEILVVNTKILGKLNDFELHRQAVNPISDKLITLVKTEAEHSRIQISQTSMWATIIMVVIGIIGVILAGVTARLLNISITYNVIKLTDVVREFRAGNLTIPFEIDSIDEIGHLAAGFAEMRETIQEKMTALHNEIIERKRAESEIRTLNEDLEERVRLRTDEIREAKEKAESANQAKSEFLSNMSHEIRTPMNAVLGFTEILKALENDSRKARYIENIHTSGHALLNLINDILDLSKIEAGKLELKYKAILLQTLFNEMDTIFNKKITDKGLQFIIDECTDIPPAIIMDEIRLRQILINLLGNAFKFTDKGYIRLSAAVQYIESPINRTDLVIIIEDSGVGIPADQHKTIFGAFEQARGEKLNQFGGTGLGLAITKRLVQMMDGKIDIESEPGKGSTFSVTFHGVEVAGSEVVKNKKDKQLNLENIIFEPATILIADDIDYNREILATYLETYKFNFIYAKNGLETIKQALAHNPDLILLDMKMPLMDGYEAAEKIKADESLKSIPIISVTASALKQDEEVISQLCDGYIRKPVSMADLVRELSRFLSHKAKIPPHLETEPQASSHMTDEELRVEMQQLPSVMINSLIEAAKTCNASGISDSMNTIRTVSVEAARRMEILLDNFDYKSILELLGYNK